MNQPPPLPAAWDMILDRKDFRAAAFTPARTELADGEILLKTCRFSLTANNVTYAMLGEAMGYWGFYPAPPGKGRVPVWGTAVVEKSRCPGLPEGTRVYGYLSMSSHLVLKPGPIRGGGFDDTTEARKSPHPFYNRFTILDGAPDHDLASEDLYVLFRPLFTTAVMIQDLLAEHRYFGAEAVLFTSASAKTALLTAFFLGQDPAAPKRIGLTSSTNEAYVKRVGLHDEVALYDGIEAIPRRALALLDFAGNGPVIDRLHRHFGDDLKTSMVIGKSHPGGAAAGRELPGPARTMFFASAQVEKKTRELGPAGLGRRLSEAWMAFLPEARKWTRVVEGRGAEALEASWRALLDGKMGPDEGQVILLEP